VLRQCVTNKVRFSNVTQTIRFQNAYGTVSIR
jgi:hypothetical protein